MKNPKFAVLNLNPGIDRVMYLSEPLKMGQLNRAAECMLSQGSKGANFSVALKRFGADIEYFSFTGGQFGEICNSFIEKEDIKAHYVKSIGGVRLNFKIVDSDGCYTEVNEKGAFVSEADIEKLLCLIEEQQFDFLTLNGSLPNGVDVSVYAKIIERMKAQNIETILDCDGWALKQGIEAKPYLIKPNRTELCELAGVSDSSIKTKADAVTICREIFKKYRVNILCTLDIDGVFYIGDEGEFSHEAIQTESKGFNGVGDTALAGFLYATIQRGFDIKTALKYSVSAASAKIKLQGSTPPQKEDVEKIFAEQS